MKSIKKFFAILLVLTMAFVVTYGSTARCEAASKKIMNAKVYRLNKKATLKGEIKKVGYYYAGEMQTNYLLYLKKPIIVQSKYTMCKMDSICVVLTKKEYKKYKNKTVSVKGKIEEASGYYCSAYKLRITK